MPPLHPDAFQSLGCPMALPGLGKDVSSGCGMGMPCLPTRKAACDTVTPATM